MKHFSAQTGGRYTYTDDVENLQSLALAINSIFSGCDNFIVSGCEVNGTSISPGIVYINGELRVFEGAVNQTWPAYIYEKNSNETVAYVNGSSKVGRINFGVLIGKSVPTTVDTITGSVPQYIQITATGGRRMKDAFFGKYALILDPATGNQVIGGNVEFSENVVVRKSLNTTKDVNVISGIKNAKHYWDGVKYVMETSGVDGVACKIEFDPAIGITFHVNGNLIQTISEAGVTLPGNKAFAASTVFGGNVLISSSEISEYGTGSDTTMYVSMAGYKGGYDYFRDIVFGDGKGNAVFQISGKNAKVASLLPFSVEAKDATITLKDTLHAFSGGSYASKILWLDKDGVSMGVLGYASGNDMQLSNAKGSITIMGSSFVNLGPMIKEGGQLLSEKYVGFTYLNQELAKKPNNSDIYNRATSDGRFAKLSGAFTQFVGVNGTTQAMLRTQIGAVGMEEVNTKHAQLNKYLSDMATSETARQQIRTNIGAAPASSYQEKLNDSGWVRVGGQTNVFARQIGKIVCIQGNATMIHEGTLFTLPTGIDSPAYTVSYRSDNHNFGAYISGGSRICVAECDAMSNHNKSTAFSMTYMTR